MNKMYGVIYITTNTLTGQQYIGMKKYTKDWEKYLGSSKLLREDIKAHGIENFKRVILEECTTLKQLQEREIFYLKQNDVLNKPHLFYNRSIPHIEFRLKRYTNCNKGKTWEEIYGVEGAKKKRDQLSSRLKNKTWEEVYGVEKAKELKTKFGYAKSPETKKKISESRKGIIFSDDHREKLRQARLAYIEKQKKQHT